MKVLGIETSCDETAASVVENGTRLLSNVVNSQIDIHAEYGGVVPEIAARSHIEAINPVIRRALADANCTWDDIDTIAVTYAPGLVGSLLVGTLAARTLAEVHAKPIYAVHHVEAHVYANFITEQSESMTPLELPSSAPKFPCVALIVSGGHTQLVLFRGHGDYEMIGQTQDDAVGEAFDKVAKILGLPYPGGPSVDAASRSGDPYRYALPKARLAGKYDFSFSGLKTAVLRAVQRETGHDHTFPSHELSGLLERQQRDDFAASFQRVAIDTLVDKAELAVRDYSPASFVIAGGVAASRELRRVLAERLPIAIEYAPMSLCTDNGAMIASLGFFMASNAKPSDIDDINIVPSLSMGKSTWASH